MLPRRFRYSWRTLAGDLSGGVIAALIALPYGLAMAALMGLPPVLGLFTSILTAPITALLGRNPVLIGGTSTVTVPFIAEAVRAFGPGGAAKITLVAAVFMMIFSVMRLGRWVARVPQPVVTGFSCGVGAMMIISQLRTIFGISTKAPAGASMFDQLIHALSKLHEARVEPLLLALLVVAVSAALSARWPKAPAPLIGVGLALAATQIFQLHEAEVGFLSLELPPFAGFAWSPLDVVAILPSGFALAFVASINILVTSRVVEHFRGWGRSMKRADADTELGAYGISNVAAGIFGAPLSVGIPARSLANVRCGGSTRLSNLFHAAVLAAVLGLGSGVLAHIPLAALAGVTAWMGFCLLDWSAWRRLPRMKWAEAGAFLSTALLVLFMNAVAAIAIGCSIHFAAIAWQRLRALPSLNRQLARAGE